MNILDLNNDIMEMVKHKLFLKQLMKHRKDNFGFSTDGATLYNWEYYEIENDFDLISLENGDWGISDFGDSDEESSLRLMVIEAHHIRYD